MGRKRWRRGSLELLLLFILHQTILGNGDVGCLFSKGVCNAQTETCYNDLAFGRCIPLYENLNDEDLYQYNFDAEELELLRLQLERLEIDGYKWTHLYTQCIMQTSLYNLRHGENYDLRLCQHFKQRDRFGQEAKVDDIARVPAIAIVKFMPNHGDTTSEFANELYYPPGITTQNQRNFYDNEFTQTPSYIEKLRKAPSRFYKPEYTSYNEYNDLPNVDYENFVRNLPKKYPNYDEIEEQKLYRTRRQPYNLRDYTGDAIDSIKNRLEEEKLSRLLLEEKNLGMKALTGDELEFLTNDKSSPDYPLDKLSDVDTDKEYEKAFSRKYKHQRNFSNSKRLEDDDSLLINAKRNMGSQEKNIDYDVTNYDKTDTLKRNKLYTEGGLIQPIIEQSSAESAGDGYDALLNDDDLDALLWRREMAGFKRRERLDVKKPGPPFSTNNYAFKTQSLSSSESKNNSEETENNDVLLNPFVKKELSSGGHTDDEHAKTYKNVDLDHVYIEFQQPFHTWSEGEHVVNEVSKLLGFKQGTLRDVRVGRAEVTFKVTQNSKNFNATDVANSINDIRGNLLNDLGVEVTRAGIGDKAKLPATLQVYHYSEKKWSLFGAVVAAGVAAAAAAAAVTLIIARRHAKSRAKLAGLATPDPEASKDYQDLCRARMQAKQPTDKPESPRINNLSRENESNNMPSNRSSTSSWSEEPTMMNMDISTGQMVLSYMEDHLKNKDRLDQEWAALCAYEPDPTSTEIAESKANAKLNRPGAALPYDHSRVVLNELANANNLDYINASTITDHDPRNPAYIATQGPLPQTTADFWQMVWEQGSVVIVMLTRVTEEGVAMCHRYWPQEDSELYHIYEVHLVSEHIWRDDYLVRSFYLKNLRTGETRTVTQFQFLSWPENGVPQSTKALLEFRRKVNKSYRGRSCPIIIHCSDGAGRTGTYCLIDIVLNRMMKGAKEIDIAATLEHIRDQRPDMVATKQQFEFVLMAVAEEVHAVLKALLVPQAEKSPAAANP